MYRRVESFTPTAYGEGVAGTLVKTFFEGENATQLNGVEPCRDQGSLSGASIPNYNELDPELKKELYLGRDRRFPSLLLALLMKDRQLLGVVYIEAEQHRQFNCDAARLLTAMMSSKLDMMQAAQRNWDRRSGLSYRFGDFEGAALDKVNLSNQDLSQAVFKMAEMVEVNMERAILTGATFDYADLRRASMRSATIVGAKFRHANLSGCGFDGADLNYCDFEGCDLSDCHLAGARIVNCSFEGANLSGVTLREADVSTLRFSKAVMRNSVLKRLVGVKDAVWGGVNLTGCRMDRDVWDSLPELVKDIHSGAVRIDS